jgi:hypothetical protein
MQPGQALKDLHGVLPPMVWPSIAVAAPQIIADFKVGEDDDRSLLFQDLAMNGPQQSLRKPSKV